MASSSRKETGLGVGLLRIGLLGVFSVSAGDSATAEDAWRLRTAETLVKLLALAPSAASTPSRPPSCFGRSKLRLRPKSHAIAKLERRVQAAGANRDWEAIVSRAVKRL
jgi:hypothetical protein